MAVKKPFILTWTTISNISLQPGVWVALLNNPKSKLPSWLKRMLLKLQGYNFHLDHIKSNTNISHFTEAYSEPSQISKMVFTRIVND